MLQKYVTIYNNYKSKMVVKNDFVITLILQLHTWSDMHVVYKIISV